MIKCGPAFAPSTTRPPPSVSRDLIGPLACLSRKLIKAIADGNAPADPTVTSLTAALPHDWATQEQRILGA